MTTDFSLPESSHVSPFEAIRRINEDGAEYWSARELARLLDYVKWDKFKVAIDRAQKACQNSGHAISDHFLQAGKLIAAGKGAQRTIEDYHLSRYACYLIVENADASKPIVALGQTYFAVQARRQELADQVKTLPEDQRRLALRAEVAIYNGRLAEAAQQAGVVKAIDFAIFQDHGYMGLYGGLKAKDIHARKGLQKGQQILDHMGSDELIANLFRASQTRQKLEREHIQGKEQANRTHHEMGRKVREFIQEVGGTLPEDLPTPEESIQELQAKEHRQLLAGQQPSLFEQEQGEDHS